MNKDYFIKDYKSRIHCGGGVSVATMRGKWNFNDEGAMNIIIFGRGDEIIFKGMNERCYAYVMGKKAGYSMNEYTIGIFNGQYEVNVYLAVKDIAPYLKSGDIEKIFFEMISNLPKKIRKYIQKKIPFTHWQVSPVTHPIALVDYKATLHGKDI